MWNVITTKERNKMMKVDIISSEIIKPSSRTPDHLRRYQLSLIDQQCPSNHFVSVHFFPNSPNCPRFTAAERSRCLKESLADVLSRFYPLAGKIQDHLMVDCNDRGAQYVEARVSSCTVNDVLDQPDNKTFRSLVVQPEELDESPIVLVQATWFVCGGMALGISICHKVADASTLGTFLRAWAKASASAIIEGGIAPTSSLALKLAGSAITTGGGTTHTSSIVIPKLAGPVISNGGSIAPTSSVVTELVGISSLFPPRDPIPENKFKDLKILFVDGIPRRYVFSSSSLAKLKFKAASESVPVPTRFEAVSALIWKLCLMVNSPGATEFAVNWTVNIRSAAEPPLPEDTFGNVIAFCPLVFKKRESTSLEDVALSDLVEVMRKGIGEFKNHKVKELFGENGREEYLKNNKQVLDIIFREGVKLYFHSSWCRFGLYEADFGWGKPAWVTPVPMTCIPGQVWFMDTRDGDGIEVQVNFADEERLVLFEKIPELIEHASLNPSAL